MGNESMAELTETDLLWLSLQEARRITDALAAQQYPTQVSISPEDLLRIVTAVEGLGSPLTAEAVARAVGDILALQGPSGQAEALLEVAAEFKKALERFGGIVGGLARSFGSSGPSHLTIDNPVANPVPSIVREQNLTPKGYQQITSLTSAVALTVPANAIYAFLVAEVADVRYRDDGTAPTATVGWPLARDTAFWYIGSLSAVKFIQVQSSGILNISYYGVS